MLVVVLDEHHVDDVVCVSLGTFATFEASRLIRLAYPVPIRRMNVDSASRESLGTNS